MKKAPEVHPFPGCPALDGFHCQTNSLAKMFLFHGHPLSEEMLLGLGAGLGFMYWRMKGDPRAGVPDSVFIGGRGNTKDFFADIGGRTGVGITVMSTAGAKKAEAALLAKLARREPVMLYGDMGFLPWFRFPGEYHFGGHTFVVCGFDGKEKMLASDMDPGAAGLKKGFYSEISLEELRMARGSTFKPFPPKNTAVDFDFSRFHAPREKDVRDAIRQEARAMLNPPIKNLGVKGIAYASKEILKWPGYFNDRDLRMNLFQIYIYIEIGGTGGGSFRPMYARFLKEAAKSTGISRLASIADSIAASAKLFTKIALLLKDAENDPDIRKRIEQAADLYKRIAELEGQAFQELAACVG